jgi:hypothetical protein
LFFWVYFLTFSCECILMLTTYLPIIQFHAEFIANYNVDQVPTILPIPTDLRSTADYAMPKYVDNYLLVCFILSFVCYVLCLLI